MTAQTFGQLFKRLRIESGESLRSFCLKHNFDPGNISRIERGRHKPPTSEVKLRQLAVALNLNEQSPEWQQFFDLAAAEQGRVPRDLLSDDELVSKLPVFFRALRQINGSDNDDDLRELADQLRRA